MAALNKPHPSISTQIPPQDTINQLINLYNQGQLAAVVEQAQALTQKYSDAFIIWNILGAAAAQTGLLNKAIAAFQRVITIKPGYAEAYNNMGNVLKDQGKLDEAIEAFNKALSLKPDYVEAYNNMGNALQDQGKLDEAIEAFNKALAIKPNYAEVIENSLTLAVQLSPIITNYLNGFNEIETQVNSEVILSPKYQVLNLIKAFLEVNFSKAASYNKEFKACDRKLLVRLTPKDKVFCNAYSSFIGKLLDANWDGQPASENQVYHLGESHSLSYAHRNITIEGSNFRITPRITFGTKAFHFSRTKCDSFKAITKAHFGSLPKNSKVFLSYGEIDCRPNEGLISAASKLNEPLEKLIDHTVSGYVQWFLEQNTGQRHHLYFINLPAPVYNEEQCADLNSEVARTVALFNTALKKYCMQHGFEMVDVFKFTVSNDGFSNELFHVDNIHLGAKALPEIEQQLS